MTVKRDITERTFKFGVAIVRFTIQFSKSLGACRTITNQLLRSGTSIGANVEEAQAAQSRKDFISKNSIALKEARETRYWLRIIVASGLSNTETVQKLLTESHELCCILGAIVARTKERP